MAFVRPWGPWSSSTHPHHSAASTHCMVQGYRKLLTALGSNVVEFLSNLNSLHLHLTSAFPAMQAPAFRCDKVGSRGDLHHACQHYLPGTGQP
jgi:hypothetical protein